MPATQTRPATENINGLRKKSAVSSRFSNGVPAEFSYPIFSRFNFFDESTLDVLSKTSRDVNAGEIEIISYDRRRDYRHYVRIRERLEDPIVCFSHPLRSIPNTHSLMLWHGFVSLFTSYYHSLILGYSFVTKYKWTRQRAYSNDWPGELGKSIRAERYNAPTRLVVPTTMSKNDAGGDKPRSWDVDKDRPLDDVVAEIAPFATGGGFDARYSLVGEHDDAVVEQAVSVPEVNDDD